MSKVTKLTLKNESRQRRDVLLLKGKEAVPCTVTAGGSVPIVEKAISPQLRDMLKRRDLYGLVLIEAPKTSKAKKEDKEEDE